MFQKRPTLFKTCSTQKRPTIPTKWLRLKLFLYFCQGKNTRRFTNSANFVNPKAEISIVIDKGKKKFFMITF